MADSVLDGREAAVNKTEGFLKAYILEDLYCYASLTIKQDTSDFTS